MSETIKRIKDKDYTVLKELKLKILDKLGDVSFVTKK